ncbi:hypothetical protein [Lentzea sp.]|uniref:hypothetical protein n=1 Tax=Lentzea sp. TaxID=56099 RepID=UPI002ED1ECD9
MELVRRSLTTADTSAVAALHHAAETADDSPAAGGLRKAREKTVGAQRIRLSHGVSTEFGAERHFHDLEVALGESLAQCPGH